MSLEIRPIAPDELDAMLVVDRRGFGSGWVAPPDGRSWVEAELERTRCAFDGDDMVGCTRSYSFEMTVPGGAVGAAAVSSVAVQPTHRRKGVLNEMISALHDDACERGEPAAILTASEGAIYGRYGYGIATWRLGLNVERRAVRFATDFGDTGRMRLVERDEAEKLIPGIYDRTQSRAGWVSRPDFWWPSVFWGFSRGADKAFFVAVHEDDSGTADGYVAYEITGEWTRGLADRRLLVWDMQSTSAETHAALWRYVFGVDLVGTVASTNSAIDDSLRLLVADPRRVTVDFVNDGLWLYPLDTVALLAARTYRAPGDLVVEVHDPNGQKVRVALDGASASATKQSPDLTCSAATLGACALGGNAWTRFAAVGLVEEHKVGALALADAMFACDPPPAMISFF